jgi:hypothetical protein
MDQPSIEKVKEEFTLECHYVGCQPIDFYSISASDEKELERFIEWIQGKRDSF